MISWEKGKMFMRVSHEGTGRWTWVLILKKEMFQIRVNGTYWKEEEEERGGGSRKREEGGRERVRV